MLGYQVGALAEPTMRGELLDFVVVCLSVRDAGSVGKPSG